ncbi:MAG: ECF transporter S component [Chloroflexota bacterium]|nr:ECF transporter S component [Chloroflexota bacterium]
MRKSFLVLIVAFVAVIAAVVASVFPSSASNVLTNWGLLATVLVVLAIIAFFFEFEAMAVSAKEIALVAMLGTISAALRVPFAALPALQPCTYLVICSGYVFGMVAGFMVGALTALVSNFFLGHGPWTPYQMFAWGLAGVSSAWLGKLKVHSVWMVVFSILWGYLFGWINNAWFWVAFVTPLTWKTFLVTQLNSIGMDSLHALGNGLFMSLFGMKTLAILERYRRRFNWTHVDINPASSGIILDKDIA